MKKAQFLMSIFLCISFLMVACKNEEVFHNGSPIYYQDSSGTLIVKDSTGLQFFPIGILNDFDMYINNLSEDTLSSVMDIWLYLYFEKEHPAQNAPKPRMLQYTYKNLSDSIELESVQTGHKRVIWPLTNLLDWDSIQVQIRPLNRTKFKDRFSYKNGELREIDAMVQQLFYRDGYQYLPETSHPKYVTLLLFSGKDTLHHIKAEVLPFYASGVMLEPGGKARK